MKDVELRCDTCGLRLNIVSDSVDNGPRLPRVLHLQPCECTTQRLEYLQFMVDNGLGPADMR